MAGFFVPSDVQLRLIFGGEHLHVRCGNKKVTYHLLYSPHFL